ncbi:MAG: ISL3 family transposase [Parachlamydiaceae bacterium]
MNAKARFHIPYIFRSFQGFSVKDIKEFHKNRHMELVLEPEKNRVRKCNVCGNRLGAMHDRYWSRAQHLRAFGWTVSVSFFREKRYCANCDKVRSEWIEFLCPTSPHITMELAWWISRLSEVTTVLQVSKLESIDKMSCYKVDKHVLQRLLQGYSIPEVTHISVDEVYARSAVQLKDGETREDLFLTVIIDHKTHKVIWVSQSRRKEALDLFFEMIGPEACQKIKVVTCDQHKGYAESVQQYCPNAALVWDRFHLVQNFNEALNEERKKEWDKTKSKTDHGYLRGKYKYLYTTKANNRTQKDRELIMQVMSENKVVAQIEMIKERFHRMFDQCHTPDEAMEELCLCYEWSEMIGAEHLSKYFWSLLDRKEIKNYFLHRLTSGVSEGINRAIKTLKWVAYGYKDMAYFALKIMQKCGYLNSKYALSWLYNENN